MLRLRIVLYGIVLLWVNVYICREFFWVEHTGRMNAVHGFWMALARLGPQQHWLTPGWWRYWEEGDAERIGNLLRNLPEGWALVGELEREGAWNASWIRQSMISSRPKKGPPIKITVD